MVMSLRAGTVAMLPAFVLVACGGGGGGATPSGSNQALGGIWFGTGTNTLQPGVVTSVVAISTDNGEFRFITDAGVQSVGQFSASGDRVTGTSVDYAPFGEVFSNGMPVTTGTYSGTVVERESIEGEWDSSTGERGDFVLVYDDRHAIPSSLSTISGTYSTFDEFGVPDGTLTIASSGNITGSDTGGCIYGGSVQIINALYNVYRLTVTAANCGEFNGSYSGLGGYDPTDSSLAFQVSNATWIISDEIYK